VTTWLNGSIEMRFRTIDGLSIRFAESEERDDHALLLELPVLPDLLPQIETPAQIIAGARHRAVPSVNAEFLHERLPHSKLDIIDAGHFTWEDGADEYAALVTSWWGRGYASAGSSPSYHREGPPDRPTT
jgi:pimeloyl-ACP methyl ester carboxylesterase